MNRHLHFLVHGACWRRSKYRTYLLLLGLFALAKTSEEVAEHSTTTSSFLLLFHRHASAVIRIIGLISAHVGVLFHLHLLLHDILFGHTFLETVEVADELPVDVHLLLIGGLLSHPSAPVLGVSLSRLMLAHSGHVGALLDGVLPQDIKVGLALELLPLVGDLLLLCDDPDALAAIKGLIGDLRLEGEALDLGEIDILHLEELGYLFQGILNGDLSLLSHVSEVLHQEGHILREVSRIFISELQALVELNLGDNICRDNWQLQNICEVFG